MNGNQSIGVIIEARLTSSRLPRKHLLLANQTAILSTMIRRLKLLDKIDKIILAIPSGIENNELRSIAEIEKIECYEGSEKNVMHRVLHAAKAFEIDIICEITGDCPIIDLSLVDESLDYFLENEFDYVNNGRTGLPDGMGCQIFRTKTLEKSFALASSNEHYEHVTLHIRENPEIFSTFYLPTKQEYIYPKLRLTLDYEEDYLLIKKIIEEFTDKNLQFSLADILSFLRKNDFDISSEKNKV